MSIRVAINGFGRIGRTVLKAIYKDGLLGRDIDIVAVSDISADAEYLAYLLKYDSIHGRFADQIDAEKSDPSKKDPDILIVDKHRITCLSASESPSQLPWKALKIDIAVESSGLFTDIKKASGHIQAGAKKVLITAPAHGDAKTIIMGVNEKEYNHKRHHILSSASCTMNALGMLVHVLTKEEIGIETTLITAINAYTASQRLVDGVSKKDRRSGRAAAVNIIPTTTSAAHTAGEIFPCLRGKVAGVSYRVPAADASAVELTFRAARDTSIQEIDRLMKNASETYLKGYLGYTEEELVSSDFINDPHSAIYDSAATIRSNIGDEKRLFRIIAWHDNEWGHANRVKDLLKYISVTY